MIRAMQARKGSLAPMIGARSSDAARKIADYLIRHVFRRECKRKTPRSPSKFDIKCRPDGARYHTSSIHLVASPVRLYLCLPSFSPLRRVMLYYHRFLLQGENGIEVMHPRARDAVARSTTVLILIVVVAVASFSAFVYLNYAKSGCVDGSGNGSTTGVVVLADYLSVPSGGSYNSSSRDWQIELGDLGGVGFKTACAKLMTDTGTLTQTVPGVPPGGSTSVEGVVASGVQPGKSYPVNITVVYDNGDSQLLHSFVRAVSTATSPGTTQVSILNQSLYFPSGNGTGAGVALWTYVVGNTGTVTISSITSTLGLEPSDELSPSFLNNIVSGDESSTGDGLSLSAFNIQAGETYSVTFLVGYANGQTQNISTSVMAQAV